MENNTFKPLTEQRLEETTKPIASNDKKTKVEQAKEDLKTVNEKMTSLQEKIKTLVANKEKSEEYKTSLKNLKRELAELNIKKAGLKKKINSAKTNAQIRKSKKYLETAKYEAIKTILEKNNIYNENAVKNLIKIKNLLYHYNIKGFKHLEQILTYVKENIPKLYE